MAVSVTTGNDPADNPAAPLVCERCFIRPWRGYAKTSFVAYLADGSPVAESRGFKSRGETQATDAARAAHTELLEQLRTLGWDRAGQGADWYDVEHQRWVAAAVIVEEAPAPAPEPVVAPAPAPAPAPVRAPVPRAEPAAAPPPVVQAPAPRAVRAVPVPAVEEAPPASAPPAKTRRRLPVVTLLSLAGLASAVGVGLFIVHYRGRVITRTTTVVVTTPAPAAAPAAVQAPAQVAPKPKPRLVHVAITAPTRASWFEIRRGSATGPVLFSGELAPGRTLHFAGARLWSRFGAAGNLEILANGRRVPLLGTYEHVFRASR